jgi:hypothetical protein
MCPHNSAASSALQLPWLSPLSGAAHTASHCTASDAALMAMWCHLAGTPAAPHSSHMVPTQLRSPCHSPLAPAGKQACPSRQSIFIISPLNMQDVLFRIWHSAKRAFSACSTSGLCYPVCDHHEQAHRGGGLALELGICKEYSPLCWGPLQR